MPTEHLHRVVVAAVAVVVLISKEGDAEQFRVPLDSGPGWEDGFVSGRPRPLFFIDVVVGVVVCRRRRRRCRCHRRRRRHRRRISKNLRRRSSHFWAFFLRRRSPGLSENSSSLES